MEKWQEVSKTLNRVVGLHQAGNHLDLMNVAVGELGRIFGGNLTKSEARFTRWNFDAMEARFVFVTPFETDFDEDGNPMAPTEEQLETNMMTVSFTFGSGSLGDYVGGCRMNDINVRVNGKLVHKHLTPSGVKQIPTADLLSWIQQIDLAQRKLDAVRSVA